jgi:hypothetical protein
VKALSIRRLKGNLPARVNSRAGFVVFGIILAITGTIIALIVIGILWDRAHQAPPPPPLPRELRYADQPLEIRFGALTTHRVGEGEALWVSEAGGGQVAVFETEESNRIIGYTSEAQLRN